MVYCTRVNYNDIAEILEKLYGHVIWVDGRVSNSYNPYDEECLTKKTKIYLYYSAASEMYGYPEIPYNMYDEIQEYPYYVLSWYEYRISDSYKCTNEEFINIIKTRRV